MSNAFHPDALSVRYLAAELDRRLRGRGAGMSPRLGGNTVSLVLDGRETLRMDVGAGDGDVAVVPGGSGPTDARITRIESPPDDRCLRIHLSGGSRFRPVDRILRIEWYGARRNAFLLEGASGRILAALRERPQGTRPIRVGDVLPAAGADPRLGAEPRELEDEDSLHEAWQRTIVDAPMEERCGALLGNFAYTSPLNAPFILGEEAVLDAARAFERWRSVASLPPAAPVIMDTGRGPRVYSIALPGARTRSVPSLLDGMRQIDDAAPEEAPTKSLDSLRAAVEKRLTRAEGRIARLREEMEDADAAPRWRRRGDILLSHLHLVPEGAETVVLPDFEGGEMVIELDPALSAPENADGFFREAGRRDRASERLPGLIAKAEAEVERLRGALDAIDRGEVPGWIEEEHGRDRGDGRSGGAEAEDRGVFRRYRTSGGLEVRVGRGRRENDRLTFGHSAPNDIWLHARSVPGSHVILRWQSQDDAPPRRDLLEAAMLAAWFSKARSSSTVPVDWTRRKHVRKPRGAPPGAVTPGRVQTVFVEPDPAVEARLRVNESG